MVEIADEVKVKADKTIANIPNVSDIPILELDTVVKTLAGKDEMNID
jgi:hypothetical protein